MQGTEQLHGGGPQSRSKVHSQALNPWPSRLSGHQGPRCTNRRKMNEFWSRVFVVNSITLSHFIYIKKKKKKSEMKITQSLKSSSANDASEPGANQWQDASLVPVLSKLYRHQLILPFWARLGLWIRSVSLTSSVTSSSLVRISHFYRSVLWRRPIQTSHF